MLLDWIAFGVTTIGVVFNAKKSTWCWPIFLIANTLWWLHWYPKEELAALIMTTVFLILNLYGWGQWKKNKGTKVE